MPILRLTVSLSVAALSGAIAPFWFAGNALSQPTLERQAAPILISQASTGAAASSTAQTTTTDQPVGTSLPSYASPGSTLQTPGVTQLTPGSTLQSPGASLSSPGATQTTNGQSPSGATTGNTGTAQGTTGSTQTTSNGQSTVNQTAPAANGTPVGPNSVLYPPQLIQGSGVAPATQPAPGIVPLQTQPTPSTAATRSVAPSSSQPSPTQLQPGQGALDAALQQATCAQNWQQAIQVVNTAIAATPTSEAGYRSQLVAYRSRLQTLQAKSVRAPNWAQQCRGGSVAAQ